MKAKKIFYCVMFGVLLLGLVTGCFNQKESNNSNSSSSSNEKLKGNCVATECINLIEPTNTVEEINKIIGLDGELQDENNNKYYWKLSEDSGIEVTYSSSDNGSISVDIDKKTLANKKVDFSNYDEIKSLLSSGQSLTYDEFVSKVGNVQGTLIGKSSYSKKYVWVNSDGGYLNASFSESTGKCTIVTGRY